MLIHVLLSCVFAVEIEEEEVVVGVERVDVVTMFEGWVDGTKSMCCMTLVTAEGT